MGKPTGFIDFERKQPLKKSIKERIQNYDELTQVMPENEIQEQGSRCMDCGIPFCHENCPLGNIIPEWNDFVYKGLWKEAYEKLIETNDFPEFTGRICPALCEGSCVLGINRKPVSISLLEVSIIEKAFSMGFVKPIKPNKQTGKKVAIVGSGPAGLAAAIQLNRVGHSVTVYEKSNFFGGLLMEGIPNFKLEKKVVDRRINLMIEEGVIFKNNVNCGIDLKGDELINQFDAICLSGGSKHPRNLSIEGHKLNGIHFAMDFLSQQTRRLLGHTGTQDKEILAEGKNVLVIGGGDTGSDCIGTSIRQGAKSVTNFELLPEPPVTRGSDNPWPEWPKVLRVSSSHDEAEVEGCVREYSVLTEKFLDDGKGNVKGISGVKVEWKKDNNGRFVMENVQGTEFEREFDLVLICMGFLHPEKSPIFGQLGVELDKRGNVKVNEKKMTNVKGVYSAGDMERGQSLVVWAISAGRIVAKSIDEQFMGKSVIIC